MPEFNGEWYPPNTMLIGERTYNVFPSPCRSEGKRRIRLRHMRRFSESREDAEYLCLHQKDILPEFQGAVFFTFAGWNDGVRCIACVDFDEGLQEWVVGFFEVTEWVAGQFPQVIDVWRHDALSGEKITAERR